jgi:hypothetical protein
VAGGEGDRAAAARGLRLQAEACASLGSPLYAFLLMRLAADTEAGGSTWRVLAGHAGDGPAPVLALRLMGAVHRLALEGQAPELAAHLPSTGGDGDHAAAWSALAELVGARRDELRAGLDRRVQTNEVGRAGALLGGFLVVARETGLPLRPLELGASAGLNLRWDAFRYEGEGATWGDPSSPVRLDVAPPVAAAVPTVVVAERAGCDPAPVDPATEDGRLTLRSYLWPDQPERRVRLEGAIALARRAPIAVDRAPAADWLAARLDEVAPGVATVVYHSMVMQYLSRAERARLTAILAEAGARATAAAPLARLAFEPAGHLAEVRLTSWPGGRERQLAAAGYHGRPLRWSGGGLPAAG